MFKKPPSDIKTSAPVRNSDRRKLKQQVVDAFHLDPEDGNLLVPDGLLLMKLSTHLGQPGSVYMSKEGDPIWFTVGRGSEQLIPTVYTLWKKLNLLPFLSTPPKVIPVLTGGADLMAPGVVQHSPQLSKDQLVSITQYTSAGLGPPLAVGTMAMSGDALARDDVSGKAVLLLHAWKDHLWVMGKSRDAPPPDPSPWTNHQGMTEAEGQAQDTSSDNEELSASAEANANEDIAGVVADDKVQLSPDEVTSILRNALIHAILQTISSLPPGSLPIASSQLYSTHILPARPAAQVATCSPIDIKHSSHKTLTAFLKAIEKEGIITLKQAKGGDVQLMSVAKSHPAYNDHQDYRTVQQEAERQKKAEARDVAEASEAASRAREMTVTEFWKPHQASIRLFEEMAKDSEAMYTAIELRTLLAEYIQAKNLVNPRDQAYVNARDDNVLVTAVRLDNNQEFVKRDKLLSQLQNQMQAWHEVDIPGKDPILRKGQLKPLTVQLEIRQGRKTCTMISGFESFSLEAEDLAEALRKRCASATSILDLPGKNAGQQVLLQGQHAAIVEQLLIQDKGVPKQWVVSKGLTKKKK